MADTSPGSLTLRYFGSFPSRFHIFSPIHCLQKNTVKIILLYIKCGTFSMYYFVFCIIFVHWVCIIWFVCPKIPKKKTTDTLWGLQETVYIWRPLCCKKQTCSTGCYFTNRQNKPIQQNLVTFEPIMQFEFPLRFIIS